mmetsp:Transcript_250/g.590  ORF Transcript_250/g.590 Transcript_250/m.590 type:complete len:267 (+) Transcript_250:567-1367(+)
MGSGKKSSEVECSGSVDCERAFFPAAFSSTIVSVSPEMGWRDPGCDPAIEGGRPLLPLLEVLSGSASASVSLSSELPLAAVWRCLMPLRSFTAARFAAVFIPTPMFEMAGASEGGTTRNRGRGTSILMHTAASTATIPRWVCMWGNTLRSERALDFLRPPGTVRRLASTGASMIAAMVKLLLTWGVAGDSESVAVSFPSRSGRAAAMGDIAGERLERRTGLTVNEPSDALLTRLGRTPGSGDMLFLRVIPIPAVMVPCFTRSFCRT